MTPASSSGDRERLRTEVAFLRAVNVGGHGMVKMTDLVRVFETAGGSHVRTFIQSGNVIFQTTAAKSPAVRKLAARAIAGLVGKDVAIAWRTADELQAIVDAKPFGALTAGPELQLYVGFLAEKPKATPKLPIARPKDGLEITRFSKGEVYVLARRIKGRSGAPNLLIEKEYAVPATVRNWNTVTKITALASG